VYHMVIIVMCGDGDVFDLIGGASSGGEGVPSLVESSRRATPSSRGAAGRAVSLHMRDERMLTDCALSFIMGELNLDCCSGS